ncbi:hypothetical protein SPSYN_02261 [Sporotomaculum syntrophicum]|uniref:Uncharacterized protein n=1 Tax=Sporotomaculum syntrophicum TaxID=182264 RepID=A0A9D2WP34_9FIRM|nr:DUF2935 domain-containing protein [Sporotomaculum syntrophicum]KAF1084483.1 hypothetical protein SPSYN_02261 [Sporotomaculum syntrophicum]
MLDETEFWKRQEAEHTVVILQTVPNLKAHYVQLLQEWVDIAGQAVLINTEQKNKRVTTGWLSLVCHSLDMQLIYKLMEM